MRPAWATYEFKVSLGNLGATYLRKEKEKEKKKIKKKEKEKKRKEKIESLGG